MAGEGYARFRYRDDDVYAADWGGDLDWVDGCMKYRVFYKRQLGWSVKSPHSVFLHSYFPTAAKAVEFIALLAKLRAI